METPGLMLKREREARGLTLNELARVTRIPESTLEAIENNDFDSQPAEVFTRGFLRNYARQLSIPTSEIMQAYDAWQKQNKSDRAEVAPTPIVLIPQAPTPSTETAAASKPESDNDNVEMVPHHAFRLAHLVIILIAVASVGLSIFFMGTGEAEESDQDYNVEPGETVESPFLISNTSGGWLEE